MQWGEAGGVDKERGLLPVPAHSQSEECEGGLLGAGDEKVGMVWDVVGMGVVGRLRSCVLQGRKRGVALFIREGLMYRERLDLGTFTEGMFESVFI